MVGTSKKSVPEMAIESRNDMAIESMTYPLVN